MTSDKQKSFCVALVGHCGPDSWMLRSTVGRALPSAEIVMVNDESDLVEGRFDLLLVNRVLDGRFDGGEMGVDLIGRVIERAGDSCGPVSMLISNFEEAQVDAMKVGAVRGFGKSEVNSESALDLIRGAVE